MGGSLPTEQSDCCWTKSALKPRCRYYLSSAEWRLRWSQRTVVHIFIYHMHGSAWKTLKNMCLEILKKLQIWQASGFNMFQLWPLANDIEWNSIWIDSTENYLSLFISIYLLPLRFYQCSDSWRSLVGPCRRLPGVQGHHPERCCAFLHGQSLRTWAAGLVMVFGEKQRLSLAISSPKAAPFSGVHVINTYWYPDHCHVASMDFGYFGPVPLWVE